MPNFNDIKKIRPVQKSIPLKNKLKPLDTPKQMDAVVAGESSTTNPSNKENEQLIELVSSLINALESFIYEQDAANTD